MSGKEFSYLQKNFSFENSDVFKFVQQVAENCFGEFPRALCVLVYDHFPLAILSA